MEFGQGPQGHAGGGGRPTVDRPTDGRPGAAATAVLAWLAATLVGIAVAWVALRPVLDAAVPHRSAPLSAVDVRRLAVPSAPGVPKLPTPWVSGTAPASPSASRSPRPSQGKPSPSATPPRATGRPSRPADPPPVVDPPTVVDGWTVTTEADGTRSYLRSFQVAGGSTVIRMVPGRVSLVSATPNPDYSVSSAQPDPTRLVVQFTATNRYDIVDAIWWNERPYAQVSNVG